MTRAASRADLRDDVEDYVLRAYSRPQLSLDVYAHAFRLRLQDALRGEGHLHFAGADTESDTSQSPVGRGVAVAADDGHAGLREPRLGPDDMDYAVAWRPYREDGDVVVGTIGIQRCHLCRRLRVGYWQVLVVRGDVMVGAGRHLCGAEDPDAALAQRGEGLRTCHFVYVLTVDVEHARIPVEDLHRVCIPYLVEKRIHLTVWLCYFRNCIYERLHRCGYDIGRGAEAVIHLALVRDLDVYLAHVVAAARDGLHEVLLDMDTTLGDVLDGGDGRIDGTVSGSSLGEGVAVEADLYGSCRYARLAADDLQPRELYAHAAARGGRTHEYLQIARGDHLLLVGQLQKTLVYLVQLIAFWRVAYLCEVVLERRAAAAGRQDDARLVYSDILGVDYLVGLTAFEHAVLMYSRRVRKGVAADNGLVGLYGHTHEVRHKTARRDDLPRIDTYLEVEILVALYCHNNLLEGRISGTLAQTVYRHLHLAGTVLDGGQRVGRGHAQIVVAVGRDDGLVDVGDVVLKVGDLGAVLARQTVTRRVGYVYDSGAGRDYGLHHAGQKLVLGAACILGVELHVIDETAARALDSVTVLLARYFTGILSESLLLTIAVTLVMMAFGMKAADAGFIGLIMGVMNVVPYAGPLIGGVVSVFVGIVSPIEGMSVGHTAFVIAGSLLILKGMDDFILQPTLYSERVKAHPLEIFLVILIAGSLAGILGMLLAIPSYTVLRVFAKEFFSQFRLVRKLTEKI